MNILFADVALTPDGWADNVRLTIAPDGKIHSAEINASRRGGDEHLANGILLPAPANLHSHAFQLAMAGMTEGRGPDGRDSFWTWRRLMYRFLEHLTPEHIEAIAAQAQVLMREAGYAAVGEFHYVHHHSGGEAYDDPAETSSRIAAAASRTGIGLTHLPVLYMQAGTDGACVVDGQLRFGCDLERFDALFQRAKATIAALPGDAAIGIAPHSLRAVPPEALAHVAELAPNGPIHIHIAEQTGEVDEIVERYGARPVEWLLANAQVDARWCLVHATHMTSEETDAVAQSGAVAGLCPITEANLGDGIFNGAQYCADGGAFGVGTDSNVCISLAGEMRTLEYSQRLRDRARSVLASADRSTGRFLFDAVCEGGARALSRQSGVLAPGHWADLLVLDGAKTELVGLARDAVLDAWIFSAGRGVVRHVWSAGRHVVRDGRHVERDAIAANYRHVLRDIRTSL